MMPIISLEAALILVYGSIAAVVAVILLAAAIATAIDTRFARRPFSAWSASFLLFGEAAYSAGFAADSLGPLVSLVCGLLVVAPAVFILARHPLAMNAAMLGHLSAVVAAASVATKMDLSLAFFYLLPLAAVIAVSHFLTRSFLRASDGGR